MDRGSSEYSDGGNSDLEHIPVSNPDTPHFLPNQTVFSAAENNTTPYRIAEMSPDQQDTHLHELAVVSINTTDTSPARSLLARVRASEILPATRESTYTLHGLFGEVAASPPDDLLRTRMMGDLSRRDGMDAAWNEALRSAIAIDSREDAARSTSLLAEVVEGQTNPDRLRQAIDVARAIPDRTLCAIAKRTIVKQELAIGNVDNALSIMTTMPHSGLAGIEREEADVHLADFFAKGGDLQRANVVVNEHIGSVTMRSWAEAKVAKYTTGISDRHLELELGHVWHFFDTRRRSEIVQDLVDGQRTDLAYKFAQHVSIPQSPTLSDKQEQATAIITVARAAAKTNPQKANDILQDLWENSIGIMDHMLSGESSFEAAQASQLAQQYATSADRATAEIIAMSYRDRPAHVTEAIEGTGFLTQQPKTSQAITCATVARNWAEAGMIDDAVRVASMIPNDGAFSTFKSETFTEVGLALRAWRGNVA